MNQFDELKKRYNILFLTARYPYPVIGGDRLKPYNIISHLSKKHNVYFISFYQGKDIPEKYIKEIEKLGCKVFVINLNPICSGIQTLLSSGKYPLEIGYYYSKKYQKIVDKIINEHDIDVGVAFFMRTAEYIKDKKISKILMAEDCRTIYQKRSYQNSTNYHQKIVRKWEFLKLIKYEPEIVNHFDITTLVTENDIAEMKKNNPSAQYRLLSNGTDIQKFIPSERDFHNKTILFAGKLDVWANQLMAEKIINKLFPAIKKKVGNVKLLIVGQNPSQSLMNKKNEEIEIIANVPDMLPYLQSASMFLHPHYGGSGIQNKLLEAMSSGCPVVTTETGNQGIDGKDSVHLMLADNDDELIFKSIEVLRDKRLAENLSKEGRKLIVKTHSWDVVFKSLDEILEEIM